MVQTAEDFTEEALAAEVEANGQLTELESTTYLPGAVAAAQSIMATLGDGPFTVNLHGEDRTTESGEWNRISVAVTSTYTAPSTVAAPVDAPVFEGTTQAEAEAADSPENPLLPPQGSVEGSEVVVPPDVLTA